MLTEREKAGGESEREEGPRVLFRLVLFSLTRHRERERERGNTEDAEKRKFSSFLDSRNWTLSSWDGSKSMQVQNEALLSQERLLEDCVQSPSLR